MFNTSHEVTNSNNRSVVLEHENRLRLLSAADRDIIRLAKNPLFPRWLEQKKTVGGCAHHIYLSGSTVTRDARTGEVISSYSTAAEPGERLAVRCRNCRASVCEPCSYLHAGDTYHLIRAGLTGGKNVPQEVRERPKLFVTLTAPSFGAVHHFLDGERCRPRRDGGVCEHGRPVGCGQIHTEDDPALGRPLCADCYDHVGHVLWHAHAGRLWDRFTTAVRRHLASARGYRAHGSVTTWWCPLAEVAHHRSEKVSDERQQEFMELLNIRVKVTGPPPPMRKGLVCSVAEWFRKNDRLVPDLTDAAWDRVVRAVRFPGGGLNPRQKGGFAPRAVLEAFFEKARTGARWPELDAKYGSTGLHGPWRRWTASGLWEELMGALEGCEGAPPPILTPCRPWN